ncbi:MAG: Transcriptional regulator, IclR family [Acidimicrobiales bacterium]|nr:Transcriptional regulator, IclR family [Acidimicrobiales bacterium]
MRNVALHSETASATVRAHPRSSERVLQLLLTVGGSRAPLSLTEAATLVGLVPSTALRQLRSLEAAGLLERDDDDQLYRPGPQLVELARTVFVGRSLASAAQPFLEQLAVTTGESVYLAVGEGSRRAAYVATSPGQHALRHSGWLGRTFPTATTAVGAALAGRVDGDGAVARENTLETGITAVSSPVRINAEIVAAVTLVGPTFRLEGDTLASARRAVVDCAAQLSDSLGTTSLDERPAR